MKQPLLFTILLSIPASAFPLRTEKLSIPRACTVIYADWIDTHEHSVTKGMKIETPQNAVPRAMDVGALILESSPVRFLSPGQEAYPFWDYEPGTRAVKLDYTNPVNSLETYVYLQGEKLDQFEAGKSSVTPLDKDMNDLLLYYSPHQRHGIKTEHGGAPFILLDCKKI